MVQSFMDNEANLEAMWGTNLNYSRMRNEGNDLNGTDSVQVLVKII